MTGNDSCKSRSSATKLELHLYDIKTNSYTNFQVNILKDEKAIFKIINKFSSHYLIRRHRKIRKPIFHQRTITHMEVG